MAFSFLTQEIAMDLGTANTVIFRNDEIVLDAPSIVAIDNTRANASRSVGRPSSCTSTQIPESRQSGLSGTA